MVEWRQVFCLWRYMYTYIPNVTSHLQNPSWQGAWRELRDQTALEVIEKKTHNFHNFDHKTMQPLNQQNCKQLLFEFCSRPRRQLLVKPWIWPGENFSIFSFSSQNFLNQQVTIFTLQDLLSIGEECEDWPVQKVWHPFLKLVFYEVLPVQTVWPLFSFFKHSFSPEAFIVFWRFWYTYPPLSSNHPAFDHYKMCGFVQANSSVWSVEIHA